MKTLIMAIIKLYASIQHLKLAVVKKTRDSGLREG